MKYRAGYKYQLAETYQHQTKIVGSTCQHEYIGLNIYGMLTILKGYAWDGCSGPTIDTKDTMRGGLVHDALYQLMRVGLLDRSWREEADLTLQRICREDGMSKFRAWYYFQGVDYFAKFASNPNAEPKILTAP